MVNLNLTLPSCLESDACLEVSEVRLSIYERSAAHTLNLVATVNVKRALEDVRYKRVCTSVIVKFEALWKKP